MPGMPENATWQRRDGLSVTEVDDDAFVVDPESEGIFHLNAVGRALWILLETPQTIDGMIATLRDAFPDVPGETVSEDTRSFIERLARRGLIQAVDGN